MKSWPRCLFIGAILLEVAIVLSVTGCLEVSDKISGIDVGDIHCERLYEFDAGDVIIDPAEADRKIEHLFRFSNPSDSESMKLSLVTKSCGCVTAELPEENVAPGEVATVKVGFSPAYADEHRVETLVVETGLEKPAHYAFRLSASIKPRLYFASADSINVKTRPGHIGHTMVQIVGIQEINEPSRPLSLSADAAWLAIEPHGDIRTHEKDGWREISRTFRLSCDERRLERLGTNGALSTNVIAAFGPWTSSKLVKVALEPYISAEPPRLFLRSEGKQTERTIVISSDEACAVLSVADDQKCLNVVMEPISPTTSRLRITLSGAAKIPPKTTIIVSTNHPRQPVLNIPVFIFDAINADRQADTGVAGR